MIVLLSISVVKPNLYDFYVIREVFIGLLILMLIIFSQISSLIIPCIVIFIYDLEPIFSL